MMRTRCALHPALSGLAALLIMLGGPASAQDKPPELPAVPANVLLAEHSNWFTPAKIYDLRKEHYPLERYPASLNYDVYSAVGYDLANTILIKGPARDKNGQRELVVIDTLGNPETTHQTIGAFRAQGILPACPPYKLGEAVPPPCRPPCPAANPTVAGADTSLDVDRDNPDCVAVIGQSKINEGGRAAPGREMSAPSTRAQPRATLTSGGGQTIVTHREDTECTQDIREDR